MKRTANAVLNDILDIMYKYVDDESEADEEATVHAILHILEDEGLMH